MAQRRWWQLLRSFANVRIRVFLYEKKNALIKVEAETEDNSA